ncbi:MAG TPA: hypothetical protein VIJ82_31875 [Streptosporangiaceae bacterium]|jgi:hypothetical protein
MKKGLLIAVGTLAAIVGVVFALQGFGVIGGSMMSGTTLWSVLGPLIALAGLIIAGAGVRQGRAATRDR